MNINVVTITTEFLASLIFLFGGMVQESMPLSPNYIEDAFEKLVAASEKLARGANALLCSLSFDDTHQS